MPFNGAGAFSPPGSDFPAVASTLIEAAKFNAVINDIATGLSTCITKDGQTTVTANIPFGGFRLTGVGAGVASTDAARVSQLQNGSGTTLGTVAGTNTITAVASPVISAYAANQKFIFLPANTNTGATTINIDGLGAKNIYLKNAACVGGELVQSVPVEIMYDGTQFQIIASGAMVTLGTVQRTIQAGDAVYTTAGGSPNALTLAISPAITAYAAGQAFKFKAGGFPNTSATTVNINSLGAKDIFNNGLACVGGEIQADSAYEIVYDGTQFNLVGSSRVTSAATATSATSATSATNASNVTGTVASGATGTTQSAGDNSTKIATTAYADAAAAAVVVAGTSCQQNPATASTVTTQAHGLSATPNMFTVYLECLSADLNYSVGDRVDTRVVGTTAGNSGYAYTYDATNVKIVTGASQLYAPDKTTGGVALITMANWKIVVVPYLVT